MLTLSFRHTDNYSLLKADGSEIKGGKAAWAAVGETYAPFTANNHIPFYVSCCETAYGYEMIGQAWVYANFPGSPSAGETKHKDSAGQEWDMKVMKRRTIPSSQNKADSHHS